VVVIEVFVGVVVVVVVVVEVRFTKQVRPAIAFLFGVA
jgi:hypothetical protein